MSDVPGCTGVTLNGCPGPIVARTHCSVRETGHGRESGASGLSKGRTPLDPATRHGDTRIAGVLRGNPAAAGYLRMVPRETKSLGGLTPVSNPSTTTRFP